ncbi:MAG: hypothetical protein KGM60_09720 [Comamonadaceae bacterium]|nr:hypothetical protein [Comamonadaceae bacterium]
MNGWPKVTGTLAWAWALPDATSTQVIASAAHLNGDCGIGVGAAGNEGWVGSVDIGGCVDGAEGVVEVTGLKVIEVDAALGVMGDIPSAVNSLPLLPPPQAERLARTSRPDNVRQWRSLRNWF